MDITIDRSNHSKNLAGHLISGILQGEDSINVLCMTLPSIKDIQSFLRGLPSFNWFQGQKEEMG